MNNNTNIFIIITIVIKKKLQPSQKLWNITDGSLIKSSPAMSWPGIKGTSIRPQPQPEDGVLLRHPRARGGYTVMVTDFAKQTNKQKNGPEIHKHTL